MSEITIGCLATLRRDVTGFRPGTGPVELKADDIVRVEAIVASVPVERYRVSRGRGWATVDAGDLEHYVYLALEAGHE